MIEKPHMGLVTMYQAHTATAMEIARAKALAKQWTREHIGYPYPTSDTNLQGTLTPSGVVLVQISEHRWDDHGWEITPILVTWEEIDNAETVLAALKQEREVNEKAHGDENKASRRRLLAELKEEFPDG